MGRQTLNKLDGLHVHSKKFVNTGHCESAVANRKRDTLRRSAAAIAGGEHTGKVGFQDAGRTTFFPQAMLSHGSASQNEAELIPCNRRRQEVRARFGPDEDIEARCRLTD